MFTVSHAHNDFIQSFAELGLFGFLPLAALTILASRSAVRAAALPPQSIHHYLGIGCAGSLLALLLHSMADFNLYIPANALAISWISGIALALNVSPSRRRSRRGEARTAELIVANTPCSQPALYTA
jgi:O-antigen ligase